MLTKCSIVRMLLLGSFVLMSCKREIAAKSTTIVSHTQTTNPDLDGFWAQKTTWSARWVKYWRPKAIYVPVWKKVWTPTIHKDWVPLPNAPTGWDKAIEAAKDS